MGVPDAAPTGYPVHVQPLFGSRRQDLILERQLPRSCARPVATAARPRQPDRHATTSVPACRAGRTHQATPRAGERHQFDLQLTRQLIQLLTAQQTQHRIHPLVRRPAALRPTVPNRARRLLLLVHDSHCRHLSIGCPTKPGAMDPACQALRGVRTVGAYGCRIGATWIFQWSGGSGGQGARTNDHSPTGAHVPVPKHLAGPCRRGR